MILGLLWTLICEAGIKSSLSSLGISPITVTTSPSTPTASQHTVLPELPPLRGKTLPAFSGSNDSIKEALRVWLQNRIEPFGVKVDNFHSSFADGNVLCALVHSIDPTLVEFPLPSVSLFIFGLSIITIILFRIIILLLILLNVLLMLRPHSAFPV